MLVEYGENKTKVITEILQYDEIYHSKDFKCECGKCEFIGLYTPCGADIIGYCFTNNGYMVVFRCPHCQDVYRHHVRLSRFSKDSLNGALSMMLEQGFNAP